MTDLASELLLGGEASSYEIEHWSYTARLLGPSGQMLSARCIDDRTRRHPDVSALLARFLAHAFARGLPAALMGRDAVVDAWDPRWPLGIPEAALQPAWAHDVLRRHGWRVDASTGAATMSTGWEPRVQGGILGAVGTAGNLLLGALGGDPIANLREAKTTFFAEPRGVRVVEERGGVVARDVVLERSRIWAFAVLHDVDAVEAEPARLVAFDATTGACALPFVHRGGTVRGRRQWLRCGLRLRARCSGGEAVGRGRARGDVSRAASLCDRNRGHSVPVSTRRHALRPSSHRVPRVPQGCCRSVARW